jgi:hypothetical protein
VAAGNELDLYSRAVTVSRNDKITSPTEERTSACGDGLVSEDVDLVLFVSGSTVVLKDFGQSTC